MKEATQERLSNAKFALLSTAVFASFASCSNLQGYLKSALNATPADFAAAYGMQGAFLMIFRLFHNVLLSFLRPRQRMVFGICVALFTQACQLAAQCVRFSDSRSNIWLAYVVFISNGMAVGTFDPNTLSVLARVSPQARYYAALGITIGIDSISVGSFALLELLRPLMTPPQICMLIFCIIIALLLAALAMTLLCVPDDRNAEVVSAAYLWHAAKNLPRFYTPLWHHTVAIVGALFSISQFAPGITLYTINNDQTVRAFGIGVPAGYFRAACIVVSFLSGIGSKMAFERTKIIFPGWFLLCAFVGDLCVISGVPELIVCGFFLINVALGGTFIQSTKLIAACTAGTSWSLAAFSLWAFLGDAGQMAAGFSQQALVLSVCGTLRERASKWDPCPYYWSE